MSCPNRSTFLFALPALATCWAISLAGCASQWVHPLAPAGVAGQAQASSASTGWGANGKPLPTSSPTMMAQTPSITPANAGLVVMPPRAGNQVLVTPPVTTVATYNPPLPAGPAPLAAGNLTQAPAPGVANELGQDDNLSLSARLDRLLGSLPPAETTSPASQAPESNTPEQPQPDTNTAIAVATPSIITEPAVQPVAKSAEQAWSIDRHPSEAEHESSHPATSPADDAFEVAADASTEEAVYETDISSSEDETEFKQATFEVATQAHPPRQLTAKTANSNLNSEADATASAGPEQGTDNASVASMNENQSLMQLPGILAEHVEQALARSTWQPRRASSTENATAGNPDPFSEDKLETAQKESVTPATHLEESPETADPENANDLSSTDAQGSEVRWRSAQPAPSQSMTSGRSSGDAEPTMATPVAESNNSQPPAASGASNTASQRKNRKIKRLGKFPERVRGN